MKIPSPAVGNGSTVKGLTAMLALRSAPVVASVKVVVAGLPPKNRLNTEPALTAAGGVQVTCVSPVPLLVKAFDCDQPRSVMTSDVPAGMSTSVTNATLF